MKGLITLLLSCAAALDFYSLEPGMSMFPGDRLLHPESNEIGLTLEQDPHRCILRLGHFYTGRPPILRHWEASECKVTFEDNRLKLKRKWLLWYGTDHSYHGAVTRDRILLVPTRIDVSTTDCEGKLSCLRFLSAHNESDVLVRISH